VFDKIPENVDVLISHSPGKFVNDTGVSIARYDKPEYGSYELTEAVKNKKPMYWFVGHVHSGNHTMTDFEGTKVVNVSIKDEDYKPIYQYKVYEI
jgi:Icc-related predicted phosphoesterase